MVVGAGVDKKSRRFPLVNGVIVWIIAAVFVAGADWCVGDCRHFMSDDDVGIGNSVGGTSNDAHVATERTIGSILTAMLVLLLRPRRTITLLSNFLNDSRDNISVNRSIESPVPNGLIHRTKTFCDV
mmetsp:Transcript_2802/g.6524  ORF Transcript_2802/g.6524 Transcript_2802/m.6524 type:complete len:127 (-) Transcript_2802:38-418(-)